MGLERVLFFISYESIKVSYNRQQKATIVLTTTNIVLSPTLYRINDNGLSY